MRDFLFARKSFFVRPKQSHQMLSHKTSDLGKRPKFSVRYPIVLSMGEYGSKSEWGTYTLEILTGSST